MAACDATFWQAWLPRRPRIFPKFLAAIRTRDVTLRGMSPALCEPLVCRSSCEVNHASFSS